jgi:NodT family efflux transporter outer membrane factor (OMF) lipoprotein
MSKLPIAPLSPSSTAPGRARPALMLAAMSALALSGCASAGGILPPIGAPKVAPQTDGAPAAFRDAPPPPAGQTAQWWARFSDPVLDRLVRAALDEAISVRQAQARIVEARNQGRAAIAGFAPRVTAAGTTDTTVALSGPDIQGANGPDDQQTTGTAALRASWEVPLFGRVSSSLLGARAGVAAAEADLEATRIALVADLAAAYIDLRAAQTQVVYLQEDLARAERLVRISTARESVGLLSVADSGQAKGQAAQIRAQLPDARLRVRAGLDRIALLRGVMPGSLDAELAPTTEPFVFKIDAPAVEAIPADLLRRRPDVRRAEQNALLASAAVGTSRSEFYPSVSITGVILLLTGLSGASIGEDVGRGSISPAISLPLFDFGQRRASLNVADARLDQALLAYRATALGAVQEGQQALAAYGEGRERAAAAAASERAAATRFDATARAFDEGLLSMRERIDAESALAAARQARLAAQAQVSDAAVGLYRTFAGAPGL